MLLTWLLKKLSLVYRRYMLGYLLDVHLDLFVKWYSYHMCILYCILLFVIFYGILTIFVYIVLLTGRLGRKALSSVVYKSTLYKHVFK